MCLLSGRFGDGHDAAARAIRDTLADHGIDAVILDVVDRYPLRLGHALKRLYLWQVSTIPVTWRWFLDWLAPTSGRGNRIAQRLALLAVGSASRGLRSLPRSDLLTIPGVLPLVLCGRNVALRARLDALPGVTALGWVDDMAAIYATADIVLQNAGRSTSLEDLAVGLPVPSYRCLPGHGQTNAANLARAGLAPWLRSRDELAPAIAEALSATGRLRSRAHRAWRRSSSPPSSPLGPIDWRADRSGRTYAVEPGSREPVPTAYEKATAPLGGHSELALRDSSTTSIRP